MTYGSQAAAATTYGEVLYPTYPQQQAPLVQQPSAPALTEQASLVQTIQSIIQYLLCQRRDIQERTRNYKSHIALLESNIRELKQLEEETDKGTMTVHKIGKWISDNRWMILSTVALAGLAGVLCCKKFSFPAIPIKIVGGGMYVQKTSYLRDYLR